MIENQIPEIQPRNTTSSKWIVLALGMGCAVLTSAGLIFFLILDFYFPRLITSQSTRTNVFTPAPDQKPNSMGDPNAPVRIIEYGDYQCPYCLRFWEDTEPQLIEAYVKTGKVYFEYRSLGAFLGPESAAAMEAAYCAGDQGKFWDYHNTLFANWKGGNAGTYSADKLRAYAKIVNLNKDVFNTCITNGTHTAQVEQDAADSKAAGVQATPSFVINGKLLIEGAQPFDIFQHIIDQELKGNNNFQNGDLYDEIKLARLFNPIISFARTLSVWT